MSIDDVDRYGRTPLYCASWNGHLGVVKYLVEKGADINAQDKGGKTSLDAATDQKHDDVIEYLKQVQLDQELLIAAQYSNFDEVRDLVNQGASLNVKYSDGMTVVHSAAYGGNLDIVKYFVANAKNILEIRDNGGRVPLHYAAYNGKLDVVKYFVDEGKVDVNLRDNDGQVPLHSASWSGHLDVVEYLISKGADINAKDKDGKTPLDVATDQKHNDVVGCLQQILNEQLLAAVQDGDFNKVKDLVNQGANINIKDNDDKTPLHYASQSFHHLDIVKYLISKDADIDAKDNNDRTPLDVADSSIIKILRQAYLDKELLLTVKSEDDLKTINSLIAKGINGGEDRHGAYYFAWEGNLDTVKLIVEGEGSVNVADKYGCTLLHWSALKGHSDIAKLLVNKGANVNAKDILGRTPMHFAVMNNHKDIQDVYGRGSTYTTAESNDEEVIQLFLMRGASINEADKNGETPLHLASWGGHLDTLQHLINNGANIGTKDSSGKTPLDIAKDKGHNNIVEYLEQKLKEEREKPAQRKRRHHHGDHDHHRSHLSRNLLAIDSSGQPEIAASSSTRPSSLFGSVKNFIGELFYSQAELPAGTSNTTNSISQVDAKMDVNGTIMLLDLLIRKVKGQKYISTADQSISPLEAQGYALNITKGFEKVVEQAALKSGISMHRLNIDYMGMQKEITRKVMSGKFNEISGILKLYVEKACPGREAGCPGKLSPKKFEKFIAQFNKGLLNQSIEQILHNRDSTLEVDGTKKQQMSLEPQSYLSNASVHSHSEVSTCLSEIGVTKLGGNLNR